MDFFFYFHFIFCFCFFSPSNNVKAKDKESPADNGRLSRTHLLFNSVKSSAYCHWFDVTGAIDPGKVAAGFAQSLIESSLQLLKRTKASILLFVYFQPFQNEVGIRSHITLNYGYSRATEHCVRFKCALESPNLRYCTIYYLLTSLSCFVLISCRYNTYVFPLPLDKREKSLYPHCSMGGNTLRVANLLTSNLMGDLVV